MSELRWWLLDDAGGIRTSADGVRFDVWQRGGTIANGEILAMAVVDGRYGPYRSFVTVFEAMAWAEQHYAEVTAPERDVER